MCVCVCVCVCVYVCASGMGELGSRASVHVCAGGLEERERGVCEAKQVGGGVRVLVRVLVRVKCIAPGMLDMEQLVLNASSFHAGAVIACDGGETERVRAREEQE